MTDATALLRGLEEHISALDRHLAQMREQRALLDSAWVPLNDLYRGQGAEVFAQAFERARQMMTTYSSNGETILNVMRDRVESLRRFDAPDAPPL